MVGLQVFVGGIEKPVKWNGLKGGRVIWNCVLQCEDKFDLLEFALQFTRILFSSVKTLFCQTTFEVFGEIISHKSLIPGIFILKQKVKTCVKK